MNAPYDRNGAYVSDDAGTAGSSRGFIAHFQVAAADAVVSDTDGIFDGIVAPNGAAEPAETTVTATAESDEFIAQPACTRNVTVTVAATTAGDVSASAIVVTGTNAAGEMITENFTPTINTPATLTGSKAFKSITSVAVPPQDGASVTVDVGFGAKLGLPYKLAHNTVLTAYLDNAKEGTAPTVATSASALESNTITLNSTLASKVVDAYLIV